MKVSVHEVFRNMRYNFFEVDDVYYILETKPSFWKTIFPFLYWLFPFPVYKVEDEKVIGRIKNPESQSMNKSNVALSAGGFAVLAATLLRDKIDDLVIQTSLPMKIISVLFIVLCILFIRLYVNRVRQRNLYKIVDLTHLDKTYVKVKPQSFKHFIQIVSIYLFSLLFAALCYVTYFSDGNFFILLVGSAMLFVLTVVSNISVKEGWTPIKFINK